MFIWERHGRLPVYANTLFNPNLSSEICPRIVEGLEFVRQNRNKYRCPLRPQRTSGNVVSSYLDECFLIRTATPFHFLPCIHVLLPFAMQCRLQEEGCVPSSCYRKHTPGSNGCMGVLRVYVPYWATGQCKIKKQPHFLYTRMCDRRVEPLHIL